MQAIPARIESEYKDMVISQLKEEIFELRKNQVHYDKLSDMVHSLELKARTFDREKERISADYEANIKRQKDLLDECRVKVAKLEHHNDQLETRLAEREREIQNLRRRADDGSTDIQKYIKENVKLSEELAKKEEKLLNTAAVLKDAQGLLKVAEGKIETQRKDLTAEKQLNQDLKNMNSDLKNKFEGLLALRRRTERDCALTEAKVIEQTKANEELAFNNQNLAKKLEEANERNDQMKSVIEKLVEELDVLSNQDEKARSLLNHREILEAVKKQQRTFDNYRPAPESRIKSS